VSQPPEEAGAPEVEGPDFSDLPDSHAELWKVVLDIEHHERLTAALKGHAPGEPAHSEALKFMQQQGAHLRVLLAVMLLDAYGIEAPDTEASPYGHAGKARAFGSDLKPPPA
jgi:hypothetical protein